LKSDLHAFLVISGAFVLTVLFFVYLFTNNPEGMPASEKEPPVSYGVDAKYYSQVIEHLQSEGHKFSDMQLCIRLVAFIYDKTPDEVRADVWAKKMAADIKKEPSEEGS